MKIYIIGNSGTGKTTLASKVANKLEIKHLDLDSIAFKDDWQFIGTDVFKGQVEEFVKNKHYVISGEWRSQLGDLIFEDTDKIIILQLPYFWNMYYLIKRTIIRCITKEELHGGNKESFRQSFFSKNSMIYYSHNKYFNRKNRNAMIVNQYPNKVLILKSHKMYKQYLSSVEL